MVGTADVVVKAVIGGLVLASVLTWTVALAKGLELLGRARRVRAPACAPSTPPRSLDDQPCSWRRPRGGCAALVGAARDRARASSGGSPRRASRSAQPGGCERLEAGAGRRMARGTGVLATIGATAPFVGLFGTVWGIMNSFIGISRAQTTNLAVVAPGIAEACWRPPSAWSPRSPRW